MDILLPDMDGLNLCKRLKKDSQTRDIPIILLSCLSDSNILRDADLYGASGFIAKPFKQAVLKSAIERALL